MCVHLSILAIVMLYGKFRRAAEAQALLNKLHAVADMDAFLDWGGGINLGAGFRDGRWWLQHHTPDDGRRGWPRYLDPRQHKNNGHLNQCSILSCRPLRA